VQCLRLGLQQYLQIPDHIQVLAEVALQDQAVLLIIPDHLVHPTTEVAVLVDQDIQLTILANQTPEHTAPLRDHLHLLITALQAVVLLEEE